VSILRCVNQGRAGLAFILVIAAITSIRSAGVAVGAEPPQVTIKPTDAGLFAETQLAWLRISVMAVSPERRSQGLGTALLAEAERQAAGRGCKYAYVDTMQYQAPHFYQKRGFALAGSIPDWDSHGHTKLFLTKRFDEPT
jgi:GNAT superfamily N-acetyltransferase